MSSTSDRIIAYFKGICVVCGHPASVVHEIEPRSRGNNPLRFENRIAICGTCHEFLHSKGIDEKTIVNLRFLRANRLKMIYGDEIPEFVDA